MCRDAKMRFAEHRRETQKTGGGPPPAPLSQSVADIVDLYKSCKTDIYCNPPPPPPSESCPSIQLTNIPIKFIL